jgi:TPR repeat protein
LKDSAGYDLNRCIYTPLSLLSWCEMGVTGAKSTKLDMPEHDSYRLRDDYQNKRMNLSSLSTGCLMYEFNYLLQKVRLSGDRVRAILNDISAQEPIPSVVRGFLLKANMGDADAFNVLGLYCYEGGEVAQNFEYACVLFAAAAEKWNLSALCNLGICCQYGKGCEVPSDLASLCYYISALCGYGPGRSNYALSLLFGDGKEKLPVKYDLTQYKEAAEWLRKGAELGDKVCKLNLASCYRSGLGVPEDKSEALRLESEVARLLPSEEPRTLIKEALYCFSEDDVIFVKRGKTKIALDFPETTSVCSDEAPPPAKRPCLGTPSQ